MITVEQALEAIDNLDDYARMETGVDPIGPRECLISFVSQYEQLRAENKRLNKQINSYKMLTKSLEETKTYLLKKVEQNKEAVETLASEREANAALTGENEELKRKLDFAEAVIAGDGALITGLKAELAEAKKDAELWREREAKIKSLKERGFLKSPLRDDPYKVVMKGK